MMASVKLKAIVDEFSRPNSVDGKSYAVARHVWFEKRMAGIRPLLKKEALSKLSRKDAIHLYKQMSVGGPRLHLQDYLGNGLKKIRTAMTYLLYGDAPIAERFYNFAGNPTSEFRLKGVNRAFASTALHLINPIRHGIWNKAIDGGLELLGMTPKKKRSEHIGKTYVRVTETLKKLQAVCGFKDLNLVDEFVELLYRGKIGADIQLTEEDDEQAFPEGKEVYKLHRTRERNMQVVKLAKTERLKKDSLLRCDVCGFSFTEAYGKSLGKGFIEAHHTLPLSEATKNTTTRIDDVALVCSNCHRMLHRRRPWLSISQLKDLTSAKQ